MSKIAIIGFHSLHLMQFLYKYTETLDNNNIDYDVIYWDRNCDAAIQNLKFKGNSICFRYRMSNYQPKAKKIIGFAKCLRFTKNKISENKYDKLILLTTQTALPLYFTCYKYRGKYIYDYRDITFEKNRICRKLIMKLRENSAFMAISSGGFINELGESDKYVVAHNCSNLQLKICPKISAPKIRVVFWGMIRQINFNQKVCDLFGNDERFQLIYHGEGYANELKEYCADRKYENIEFTGRYLVNEINGFAKETDILLNLYENDRQQSPALTVKLYDGIRYQIPMIISAKSYMASYMDKYSFVFKIDTLERECLDSIVHWYRKLPKLNNEYKEVFNCIQQDEKKFNDELLHFVTS